MNIPRSFRSLGKRALFWIGPSALWMVPDAALREKLGLRMHQQRKDHASVVKLAESLPAGELNVKATLEAAASARISGRDDLSRELLNECYKKHKTSTPLLVALGNDLLLSGKNDEAMVYARRAVILAPASLPAAMFYLSVRRNVPGDDVVDAALLRRHKKSSPFVWEICKQCRTQDDLNLLFDGLQTKGELPLKFIRPYSNAALRAERFDLGRAQFLRAISSAAERRKFSAAPPKTIGSSGTEALKDVVGLLNEAGIPHFAAAGTCLGMVREGRPLAHDNDIDIGIMDTDWRPEKLRNLIAGSVLFKLDLSHPKTPKIGAVHHTGATIDFFRFYEEDGKIWHNGVFVRWGNAPFALETRDLEGVPITIPSGTDYLVENYGDWQTPDPLFDAFLNGPNREVTWPEYYAAHILRTINLTLRQGQRAKAIAAIRDGIEGPWLTEQEKDALRTIEKVVSRQIASMESNDPPQKAAPDA